MWGNPLKAKDKETKADAQSFTAEVNGVKLTAPTQEALMAMIPTVQGIKPASALEPEPGAAGAPVAQPQPAQVAQPGQPQATTKWTLEQFQQKMASGDLHGSIMGIISQALEVPDFAAHIGQTSRALEGVYKFAHNNMIGSALVGAGVEPTAANVQKFEQLMGTRPQTEQQPTMENYAKFATHVTAPERQWIAKAPVAQPQLQVGPDGKPIPVDPNAPVLPGATVMPQAPAVPVPGVPLAPGAPVYATSVAGPQAVAEAKFPARVTPQAPLEDVLLGQQSGEAGNSETAEAAEGLSLADLEQNLAEASAMPVPA